MSAEGLGPAKASFLDAMLSLCSSGTARAGRAQG
jgi:hypothetical protein